MSLSTYLSASLDLPALIVCLSLFLNVWRFRVFWNCLQMHFLNVESLLNITIARFVKFSLSVTVIFGQYFSLGNIVVIWPRFQFVGSKLGTKRWKVSPWQITVIMWCIKQPGIVSFFSEITSVAQKFCQYLGVDSVTSKISMTWCFWYYCLNFSSTFPIKNVYFSSVICFRLNVELIRKKLFLRD